MAYDATLAARIREVLPSEAFTERRAFGGLAFLLAGNMAVAASNSGDLMVRCDPADTDAHVAAGAQRKIMRGRALDGWLDLDATQLVDEQTLAHWVEVGVAYARTLPPK